MKHLSQIALLVLAAPLFVACGGASQAQLSDAAKVALSCLPVHDAVRAMSKEEVEALLAESAACLAAKVQPDAGVVP